MAQSETRGDDSGRASENRVRRDPETPAAQGAGTGDTQAERTTPPERPTTRYPSSRASSAERDRMLKEARAVEFPVAMRGYERTAVDRYVQRVNRLIAELEISSSPESAVRHALDEVSEETRDILQRAHQTADEITVRSRSRADDRLQQAEQEAQEIRAAGQRDVDTARETSMREISELRETTTRELAELRESTSRETQQERSAAKREADELRASARRDADEMLGRAEAHAREVSHNAQTVWRERRRLIEDVKAVGEQLVAIGEAEGRRFSEFARDTLLVAEQRGERDPGPSSAPATSSAPEGVDA